MLQNWSVKFHKAALAAVVLVMTGCASKPLVSGEGLWTTYQGDYSRTNLSLAPIELPLTVGWGKDISDFRLMRPHPEEHLSAPAISSGTLYAGSAKGILYATDLATGRVIWKFDAKSPIEAPPTVTGEMVCFGSSDGVLRCLDLAGKELWSFQARSEILSSPVLRGSKLFFSSSDDRLYALDASNAERLWTYSRAVYKTVTPRVYASPALSEKGNLVHFFSDGTVACISAETGKEIWSRQTVKEFDGSVPPRRTPMAVSGSVYVIDGSEALLVLSEADGEIKAIFNTIKAKDFVLPDERTMVIVGEAQAIAVDRSTGAQLWKTPLERGPVSSVMSAGGYLFILSNFTRAPLGLKWFSKDTGYMEALRLSDGTRAWGRKLSSSISADASSASGRVALLVNDGVLTVFEQR